MCIAMMTMIRLGLMMTMNNRVVHSKIPSGRYPRCHYNARHKAKRVYDSVDDAERFISRHRLVGYTAYECNVCHMIHIGLKV